MYEELIQQARELCEGTSTNYYTDVLVPQLCDALEAAQKENERLSERIDGERRKFIPWMDAAEQYRKDCHEATARAEKAEAKNRWIPVNERLPEESEYRNRDRCKSMDSNDLVPFLACCKDTEIPFRAFYDGKNWGDGWNKMDVICWMPLPEPPKGAQDE